MPVAQARRLCPQAVFLPADLKAYSAVHTELLELFGRFTDLVEPVSIDEAVLDVAGSRRLFGPPRAIAGRIQELVYDEQGLTCTLGVAPNKLLAKLAANLNKPAGIGVLNDADVHGRLRALPVGEAFGVGPVTQERLHALGLTTVGMLQDVPLPYLAAAFGRGARPLKQLAFGRSLSPVRPAAAAPSSMSHETTFATDTAEPLALRATLLALTDGSSRRGCASSATRRAPWRSRCATTPSTRSSATSPCRGPRRAPAPSTPPPPACSPTSTSARGASVCWASR